MRVALLCATRRGYQFLARLSELLPDDELVVCSFREEPWEPPFLDDIRTLAREKGATFIETRQVASGPAAEFFESHPVDLMLVVSWRYLIPESIYLRPRGGTYVFHDSLLPMYRGFAPTVWAMINGEDHTGVTLFRISEEMDTGDTVGQKRITIGADETIGVIMDRVTNGYLELLEQHLQPLMDGTATLQPQDHSLATYCCRRIPEDNAISWDLSTNRIYDLIRATTRPYPGARTTLHGKTLRVWSARRIPAPARYAGRIPGRVVGVLPREGTMVLTGDGLLLLTEVELEGGSPVCAAEVLNSLSMKLGT